MNSDGINALARVLQARMKGAAAAPPPMELATVRGGSLITDGGELEIPLEDAARLRATDECGLVLRAGDRVLLAYIDGDVVVLGKLEG